MIYKTNTQNYASKNVNNFSDFIDSIESEKSELKDIKRSINPNTNDTQKYAKNSKFKFNKVTRKMDDLSLPEIDDKLNAIEESSTDVNIASMRRFLEDYAETHSAFEKRGMDEGVEILRNSNSVEEGILNINKKIDELTKKEKEFMPQDQKEDMIKGLSDLVKNLESKLISESRINDDMFIKLTNKPSYKELVSDFVDAIKKYKVSLDEDFDEGDSDHDMALSATITEACNDALQYIG